MKGPAQERALALRQSDNRFGQRCRAELLNSALLKCRQLQGLLLAAWRRSLHRAGKITARCRSHIVQVRPHRFPRSPLGYCDHRQRVQCLVLLLDPASLFRMWCECAYDSGLSKACRSAAQKRPCHLPRKIGRTTRSWVPRCRNSHLQPCEAHVNRSSVRYARVRQVRQRSVRRRACGFRTITRLTLPQHHRRERSSGKVRTGNVELHSPSRQSKLPALAVPNGSFLASLRHRPIQRYPSSGRPYSFHIHSAQRRRHPACV